ncbi:hypothetical protein THAOC_11849 [Thalassiosira oceanica]|uniref:Uncharacterized protein n=1 Tax=Thalassiosira oceanica TaxID=159749 RepID=K0T1P1_THAOC|nr:hypothetical protein THAOC_11849 [Thalassiosira oceanica]|eukprot:EJK67156.1 hypothetical protein THAOC_11849 [Thalassiosira oceanica]
MSKYSPNDDSTMKCSGIQRPRNENSDDTATIDDSTRSLTTIDSIFSFYIDGVDDLQQPTPQNQEWMTSLGQAEFPTGVSLRDLGLPGSDKPKRDLREGDTVYPSFDDFGEHPPQILLEQVEDSAQPTRRRWSSLT